MAINFPDTPNDGDIFTSNGKKWIYGGGKWSSYGLAIAPDVLKVDSVNNRVGVNNLSPSVDLDVTGDAAVSGSLTVDGDLTISGNTTTLNTTELYVEDNKVTLNSGATGSATANAGIEVERGDDPNVEILWDESADAWKIATDFTVDTSTFHVDSTNNRVGIGTTSPANPLEIYGGTADAVLHVGSGDAGSYITFADSTTTGAYWRNRIGINGNDLRFDTDFTNRMTITSSGNVGIGTTTPGYPLHVVGDVAFISSGSNAATHLPYSDGHNYFTSDASITNGGNHYFRWDAGSGSTYQMTILQNGNVGIGTTSPTQLLHVNGNAQLGRIGVNGSVDGTASLVVENGSTAGGSNTNILTYASSSRRGLTIGATSTSGRVHIEFKNYNGGVGSITTSGTATAFNTSSDYRLKENLVQITNAAQRISAIPVYEFNFISDPETTVSGFVAHELAEHIPEAVFGEKDAVDENGEPVMQGVDQSKVVPLLTAAVKEVLETIQELSARIEALEAG